MARSLSGFDATVVASLQARDLAEVRDSWYWNGWKFHRWPADVVRPGLKLYAVNLRSRKLFALLQVTRGGSFTYASKSQFSQAVYQLTGWRPSAASSQWQRIPSRGTGVALRWKVIKPVSIDLPGKFERIGWHYLGTKEQLDSLRHDFSDLYEEGQPRLRTHIQIERDPKLRRDSKTYCRGKLGGLRCLVCQFDFAKRYGDRGSDFIEMHHIDPLGVSRGVQRSVQDLIPLCSNCHRMVHRYPENPLTLKELKQLIV